jgi:hypothetical protein
MVGAKKKVEKVLYLGTDTGFFQNITQRYKNTYDKFAWDFPVLSLSESDFAEQLFLKIIDSHPAIVYLDFCQYTEAVMILAEIMSRDPYFINIPIVGLVDNKEDTVPLLGTGIDFIYVKGGEFHDIIYAPMNVAFPKSVVRPNFAKGKVAEEIDLIDDFRVSFVTPSYMHVEGNFYLEEEQPVYFKTDVPVKNVPSHMFEVKNRTESNLYYDYNYAYDLDFKFVDMPEMPESAQDDAMGIEDEKERVKAIKAAKQKQRDILADFEDSLRIAQKRHKEWVIDQMDEKPPKKTKLLIVDESMRVYRSNKNEDFSKSPYLIRCQTRFADRLADLNRLRPAIIAYQCVSEYGPEDEEDYNKILQVIKSDDVSLIENEVEPEVKKKLQYLYDTIPEREKEEMAFMSNLLQFVKGLDNYSPIIVFFRCYFQTSKALQESFNYPMLVTHSESISLGVCQNLAQIYESKQNEKMDKLIKAKVAQLKAKDPQKYRRLTESDFEEKKYFIKGKKNLAYGSIKLPVILSQLSESEVEFRTELLLPMKTYRLNFPIEMSIHLVPMEEGKDYIDDKGLKTYRGVIHSISENDKKTLRQQVNDVFFEPLKEKRQKEQEEFDQLNHKVGEERKEKVKTKEEIAKEQLGMNSDPSKDSSES